MFANLPSRRFGVEIEFVGITPAVACAALVAAGVVCREENYGHSLPCAWKIVPDGSIHISPGMPYGACGELVSPPLSGVEGIEEVRRALRALVSAGATVNASCGLHVHVDAGDLSASQIASLLRRYSAFQAGIDAFMPASRRNSRWAQRIDPAQIVAVESSHNLRDTAARLDRYRVINVAAFARHGTLEFRQHSASVNGGKVARWVAFVLFFVAASVQTAPVAAPVAPVSVAAARGRRPNFAARREVVRLLSAPGGATLSILANGTGYTEGTLQASVFGALRGMGRLSLVGGYYRFTPTRLAMLASWQGIGAPVAPVAPVAADSLWRGIPSELCQFYTERAMDLDPR